MAIFLKVTLKFRKIFWKKIYLRAICFYIINANYAVFQFHYIFLKSTYLHKNNLLYSKQKYLLLKKLHVIKLTAHIKLRHCKMIKRK